MLTTNSSSKSKKQTRRVTNLQLFLMSLTVESFLFWALRLRLNTPSDSSSTTTSATTIVCTLPTWMLRPGMPHHKTSEPLKSPAQRLRLIGTRLETPTNTLSITVAVASQIRKLTTHSIDSKTLKLIANMSSMSRLTTTIASLSAQLQ